MRFLLRICGQLAVGVGGLLCFFGNKDLLSSFTRGGIGVVR